MVQSPTQSKKKRQQKEQWGQRFEATGKRGWVVWSEFEKEGIIYRGWGGGQGGVFIKLELVNLRRVATSTLIVYELMSRLEHGAALRVFSKRPSGLSLWKHFGVIVTFNAKFSFDLEMVRI